MGSEKRFTVTKGSMILISVLILGFVASAPHITSYYVTSLMCMIFFYIGLVQGLNVLTGFTGYVNFGYAGWVGLGSYATMIFLNKLNMHWLPAFFLSGLFAMLVGIVIGHPLLKIRGIYFAIAAFTFTEGLRFLVSSELLSPLTHGGEGVSVNNPGLPLAGQYYVGLAIAVIATGVVYKVSTSRFGLRLLAIKGEELPTQCLGINTTMHKIVAFAISSFFAGTVGGLMAVYTFFITPEASFSVEITLQTILMLNLGGGGTVLGPVFAAIFLTLVAELLWSKFVFLHTGLLGIVLVLVILFLPQGIVPWLQDRRLLPFSRKL